MKNRIASLLLAALMLATLCLPVIAAGTDEPASAPAEDLNDSIIWQLVDKVTEDGYYLILGEVSDSGYEFLRAADIYPDNKQIYTHLSRRDRPDYTEYPGDTVSCPDTYCVWKLSLTKDGNLTMYSPERRAYLSILDLAMLSTGFGYDSEPFEFGVQYRDGKASIGGRFIPEDKGYWSCQDLSNYGFTFYKAVCTTDRSVVTRDTMLSGINTKDAAKVFFGGNAYRVIGYGAAENNVGVTVADRPADAYTLFAEYSADRKTEFRKSKETQNKYAQSALREKVDEMFSALSDAEKSAVLPRTLPVGSYDAKEARAKNYTDGVAGDAVENAALWPLSTKEAAQVNTELFPERGSTSINAIWLRSPGSINNSTIHAAYVEARKLYPAGGMLGSVSGGIENGVCPAFNLDSKSVVLYTATDADLSKVSAVGKGNGEYKLTLRDETHKNFAVTKTEQKGNTLTVRYSGAVVGEKEKFALLVKDIYGRVTFFGAVGTPTAAEGSVSFTLPDISDTDTVSLLELTVNEGNETNTGSELVSLGSFRLYEKSVMLGNGILKKNINTELSAAVYFGMAEGKPTLYRVVGYGDEKNHIGIDSVDRGASDFTLFCQGHVGTAHDKLPTITKTSYTYDQTELYSILCGICPTDALKEAIAPRTLLPFNHNNAGHEDARSGIVKPNCVYDIGERVFSNTCFWSVNPYEWIHMEGNLRNYSEGNGYFLNGICNTSAGVCELTVYRVTNYRNSVGNISGSTGPFYVRPAFNLAGDKIVMTTAAVGGKNAAVGSTLSPVGLNETHEWKLTVADTAHKDFAVSNATVSGKTVSFAYTGAQVGENECVSVVGVDESGSVAYYGKVAAVKNASGSATFTLPETDGNLKLYVMQEQANGDKMSDFASPLIEITPTASELGSVLSQGNIWIIIAVAVVVIAGIATLVIVKKKKKPVLASGENTDEE